MTENMNQNNANKDFYDVVIDKLIALAQMPKFTDLFGFRDVRSPITTNQGLIKIQPWDRWHVCVEQNTGLISKELRPYKKNSYENPKLSTSWACNGLYQMLFFMHIDLPRDKYYQLEKCLVDAYDTQQEKLEQNPELQFGQNESFSNDLRVLAQQCFFLTPQDYATRLVDLMLKHTR